MTNPFWGNWGHLADDQVVGRHGALRRKSKNLGDGGWCVECLKNKFYSWIDVHSIDLCPNCKTKYPEITNKDKLEE